MTPEVCPNFTLWCILLMLVDSGKEATLLENMQLVCDTRFSWKNNWFTDGIFPKTANEFNMQMYGRSRWNHVIYYQPWSQHGGRYALWIGITLIWILLMCCVQRSNQRYLPCGSRVIQLISRIISIRSICFASSTDVLPVHLIANSPHWNWYGFLKSGTFSTDEHIVGLDPSRGTELCAVM